MNAIIAAVLVACSASAQQTWQEMLSAEVVAPAPELALELARDKARLGERAGRVTLKGGTMVRSRAPGASWRYSVNYNGLETSGVEEYLVVAELRGIISADRDRVIRSEVTAGLMPEAESVAARLAFLDSARAQVREDFSRRFPGRTLPAAARAGQAKDELELAAALDRLDFEWQTAARRCRSLASHAELGRALSCPR